MRRVLLELLAAGARRPEVLEEQIRETLLVVLSSGEPTLTAITMSGLQS